MSWKTIRVEGTLALGARQRDTPIFHAALVQTSNGSLFSTSGASSVRMDVYKKLAFSVSTIDNFLNNPQVGYNKNPFRFSTGFALNLIDPGCFAMVR
jgi:hypothetical protein